jgi:hypothetical protein
MGQFGITFLGGAFSDSTGFQIERFTITSQVNPNAYEIAVPPSTPASGNNTGAYIALLPRGAVATSNIVFTGVGNAPSMTLPSGQSACKIRSSGNTPGTWSWTNNGGLPNAFGIPVISGTGLKRVIFVGDSIPGNYSTDPTGYKDVGSGNAVASRLGGWPALVARWLGPKWVVLDQNIPSQAITGAGNSLTAQAATIDALYDSTAPVQIMVGFELVNEWNGPGGGASGQAAALYVKWQTYFAARKAACPGLKTILCTVNDTSTGAGYTTDYQAFNTPVGAGGANIDGFADLAADLFGAVGAFTTYDGSLFSPDGLHPNDPAQVPAARRILTSILGFDPAPVTGGFSGYQEF